jgi:predicted phage baseplate assembly protein
VDVEVSIGIAAPTDIIIQPGLRFTLSGPDGQPLYYEVFRAPNDFKSNIQIPSGKRGIVAYGIEGKFGDPIVAISAGGPDQIVEIVAANVLDEPIIIDVTTGATTVTWRRVSFLEQAGPNDEVFEVQFTSDGVMIKFGNDVAGKAPLAGQGIKISYRQGGGVRGRIPANAINETRPVRPLPPASAAVEVLLRNLQPSSGGEDKETLDNAKKRAPRDYATHNNAATALDYAEIASTFSHPVYGAVLKAVATILTNINANLVDVYVLAAGPNDVPVTPSTGLKEGLRSFLRDNNVMTDDVSVKDGGVKPVPIEMVVVVSRSGDAPTVKEQVNSAISSFFDIANRDMGAGMDISPFQTLIQQIPGVKNVNLYQPADDIISTKSAFEDAPNRIGYAQLLTLGAQNVKFYLEKPPGGR